MRSSALTTDTSLCPSHPKVLGLGRLHYLHCLSGDRAGRWYNQAYYLPTHVLVSYCRGASLLFYRYTATRAYYLPSSTIVNSGSLSRFHTFPDKNLPANSLYRQRRTPLAPAYGHSSGFDSCNLLVLSPPAASATYLLLPTSQGTQGTHRPSPTPPRLLSSSP